jgi:hypothetical protein
MVNPDKDDEEEKPLDPAVARVQAKLQRLMLIAGLTLGVGILAVFLAIIYRIVAADDKALVVAGEGPPQAVAEAQLAEPPTAASEDATQQEGGADNATAVPPSLPPVAIEPPAHAESGSVAPRTPAAVLAVETSIPADARLMASTVAGGRIVLTYDHFGGTIVIVVDPDTLQVVGRLDLMPE